jgi:hypothetical protein
VVPFDRLWSGSALVLLVLLKGKLQACKANCLSSGLFRFYVFDKARSLKMVLYLQRRVYLEKETEEDSVDEADEVAREL